MPLGVVHGSRSTNFGDSGKGGRKKEEEIEGKSTDGQKRVKRQAVVGTRCGQGATSKLEADYRGPDETDPEPRTRPRWGTTNRNEREGGQDEDVWVREPLPESVMEGGSHEGPDKQKGSKPGRRRRVGTDGM